MIGIPVKIVTSGGIPVRSVAQGKGIPAYVDNRNGISVRIGTGAWLPPFYIAGQGPVDPAPAFTTQPSISGTPQVGQTLTGTDGTGTNYTTYSRQWLRGSTAISGATGSNYTLTADDIGFNISRRDTLTGTTAPPAVATTNAIGPVTAAQEPWTPNDLPAEYRTNGGMWDAANVTPVDTNQVATVPDSWAVRDMVQPTVANRPFYGTRNGFPAVVWPDTPGNRFVAVTTSFQPVYYIEVAQFQTGTETATDANLTHIIGGDNDGVGARVRLRGNTGSLNAADGNFQVAKNGTEAWSTMVLPLPMSIMEIQGSFNGTLWGAGRSSVAGRAWRGPKLWWMFLGQVPTLDLRQRLQGYLAWRYNLVASLPADHPYKNAPPMRDSLVVQQNGSNFTMQPPASNQGLTVNQSGSDFALSGA